MDVRGGARASFEGDCESVRWKIHSKDGRLTNISTTQSETSSNAHSSALPTCPLPSTLFACARISVQASSTALTIPLHPRREKDSVGSRGERRTLSLAYDSDKEKAGDKPAGEGVARGARKGKYGDMRRRNSETLERTSSVYADGVD